MESETAHLELSIEVGSDPITGMVLNGRYGCRPFSGWIELVGAIEAARSAGAGSAGSGEGATEAARSAGAGSAGSGETRKENLGPPPGAKAPGL